MTYEAVTLIIEHYNITMNVSSAMYHTMIDSDICIMITITTITVIGTMWIISCPKYIITSNSHSVRRVTAGSSVSCHIHHTQGSSNRWYLLWVHKNPTDLLLVVSLLIQLTHCFQPICEWRLHQWGCFGQKGEEERKSRRRKRRDGGQGPISLADEFTSLTCSAVSPEIKYRFTFFVKVNHSQTTLI